jgi:two-component system cell cycle sensor histidine kinase/response regulator CckA
MARRSTSTCPGWTAISAARSSFSRAGPLRGTETVLLVEDERQMRIIAENMLRRHGYNALVAQNAGDALLICERESGAIDLLLSDLVMPI